MPHFDFQTLNIEGEPIGKPVKVKTLEGLLILCPAAMKVSKVQHLAELAYASPDWPVDLTHFEGSGDNQRLVWSARIYYRSISDEPVRAIQ